MKPPEYLRAKLLKHTEEHPVPRRMPPPHNGRTVWYYCPDLNIARKFDASRRSRRRRGVRAARPGAAAYQAEVAVELDRLSAEGREQRLTFAPPAGRAPKGAVVPPGTTAPSPCPSAHATADPGGPVPVPASRAARPHLECLWSVPG